MILGSKSNDMWDTHQVVVPSDDKFRLRMERQSEKWEEKRFQKWNAGDGRKETSILSVSIFRQSIRDPMQEPIIVFSVDCMFIKAWKPVYLEEELLKEEC